MRKEEKIAAVMALGAFLLVVVFFGAIICIDIVDPTEQGVMVRLGEIRGIMRPGLRWTGAFTHVEKYDMKIRKMDIMMTDEMSSSVDKDGQAVYAEIQVNYRVNPENVVDAYTNVGTSRNLEKNLLIGGIVREQFKSVTGEYTSEYMWQNRNVIKESAKERIIANFPSNYFILENVVISGLDFNKEFKDAIELKKTNEQTALAEEQAVDIERYRADQKIEEARGRAESAALEKRLAGEADAEVIRLIGQAEADALGAKRTELTPLMVQNNLLDQWDGTLPQYLIFGESDVSSLLLQPISMEE